MAVRGRSWGVAAVSTPGACQLHALPTHTHAPRTCTRPGTHREPNNIAGGEDCAGANATQMFEGLWGWADANCNLKFPYICETAGNL
jgi:hypothetical protein